MDMLGDMRPGEQSTELPQSTAGHRPADQYKNHRSFMPESQRDTAETFLTIKKYSKSAN